MGYPNQNQNKEMKGNEMSTKECTIHIFDIITKGMTNCALDSTKDENKK